MAPPRKTQQKDVVTRLSDAGEDALQRLGELPGGKYMLKAMTDVRSGIDELGAKLRRIDPLERRVAAIEKRLDALDKPKAKAKTTSSKRRRTTAAKSKPAADVAPAPEPERASSIEF
jgi:serine/threonine protein kinase HipA of HipAB toxin-antitoxin module